MTAGQADPGRRDALTYAGYGALAAWAWFLYGFGPMLTVLRAEQGSSRTVMGMHSLFMAGGSIVAGLVTVRVLARLRRRGTMLVGLGLASGGVVVLCLAGPPQVSLPAVLVAGIGGSLLLNAANPALTDHHGPAGPAILSEGNALAAGVGLVAPLAVGAGVALGLTWRPGIALFLPVALVVAWLVRRVPAGWPAIDGGGPAQAAAGHRLRVPYWLLLVALMAAVGVEFCATAWSADLLRQRTGLSAGAASAAVALYVGGMFVGRALGGRLARTRSPRMLLRLGLILVAAGWALMWTTSSPWFGMIGLGLLGLGMSIQFPLIAALAFAAAPGAGDRASAAMSLGIGAAAALTPFAAGAIADAASTHVAFLLVPALAAVLLAALAAEQLAGSRRPVPPVG